MMIIVIIIITAHTCLPLKARRRRPRLRWLNYFSTCSAEFARSTRPVQPSWTLRKRHFHSRFVRLERLFQPSYHFAVGPFGYLFLYCLTTLYRGVTRRVQRVPVCSRSSLFSLVLRFDSILRVTSTSTRMVVVRWLAKRIAWNVERPLFPGLLFARSIVSAIEFRNSIQFNGSAKRVIVWQ